MTNRIALDPGPAPAKIPPIDRVWRLTLANLIGLVATLLGFGSVVYVLHHDSAEKRSEICTAVGQFGDDLTTELAAASHTDPNSPQANAFRARLHEHLRNCG